MGITAVMIVCAILFRDYRFEGYGSYIGIVWPSTEHIRAVIPTFIEGVLTMFSSYYGDEELLGPMTLARGIKLLVVLVCIGCWLAEIIRMIRHGHDDEQSVEEFLTISLFCQCIAAFCNGETYLIVRYSEGFFWTPIILGCRKCIKWYVKEKRIYIKRGCIDRLQCCC